jgi:hypothetical protein
MYAEKYLVRYHPPHTLFIKIQKLLINHGSYSVKIVCKQPRIKNNNNENVELQVLIYISLNPPRNPVFPKLVDTWYIYIHIYSGTSITRIGRGQKKIFRLYFI